MERALAYVISHMLNGRYTKRTAKELDDLLTCAGLSEPERRRVYLHTLSIYGWGAQNSARALLPLIPAGTDLGFDAMFYVVREQVRLMRWNAFPRVWPDSSLLALHLEANGHYLRDCMEELKVYPSIVFTTYKEWALAHDEWDEKDERLNPEAAA